MVSVFFGTMIVLIAILLARRSRAESGNGQAITLSCKGVASLIGFDSSESIKSMDIVVDVSAHSVVGFGGVVAKIDKIDKDGISFSGDRSIIVPGASRNPFSSSVVGFANRIGGEVTATLTTVTLTSRLLSKKYDLRCKRVSKLFDIAVQK